MITAGFGITDITPTVGSHMPGGFSARVSTGIADPLQARACLLCAEETVVIVGIDAVSLGGPTVEAARAEIEARLGIPGRNVVIAANHTHCGGPANDVLGTDASPAYLNLVREQIVAATLQAAASAEPALLASGVGSCPGWAFNRRWVMRSGAQATNPGRKNPEMVEPAGPVDPDVALIAVLSPDGVLRGCITNFACHCTVMSGTRFSGDYPAYWQKALRQHLGDEVTMVFLNGACGDINQIDFSRDDRRESGSEWAAAMGKALAQTTLATLNGLTPEDSPRICSAHGHTEVAYRHPSPEQLAEDKRTLDDPEAQGKSAYWLARDRILLAESLAGAESLTVPVDVFRLGRATLASAPWQPFCEFGLRIKGDCPAPTLVAAFANGMIGYVPTPEAFLGGGYEPTLCRGSKLQPDAGERIVEETLRLVSRLPDA